MLGKVICVVAVDGKIEWGNLVSERVGFRFCFRKFHEYDPFALRLYDLILGSKFGL